MIPRRLVLAICLAPLMLLVGCASAPRSAEEPAPPEPTGEDEDGPLEAPSLRPTPNRLLEIAYTGNDGNIHTTDRRGRDTVQVTRRPQSDGELRVRYGLPRWSPDGRALAYTAFVQGSEERWAAVHAVRSDGSAARIVLQRTGISPLYLAWSETTRLIGVLGAERGSSELELRTVPVAIPGAAEEATTPRTVVTGRPLYWELCQDGEHIVVHVDGIRQYDGRVVMFPTTGATVAATVETDPTAFRAPACVPGSHHVLLASHTPAGARVEDSETEQTEEQRPAYLVLTDTESGRRRHVAEIRGRSAFSISPDGRRIAFIDGSTTRFGAIRGQLHVARLEDGVPGEPRHIADAPSVLAFFWSPDGSRLLYFQPAFEGEEPTELLLRYTVTDFADGSTHQFPPVRLSPAFANEVVYRFDQFDRGADIWAPDGSAIVAGLVDQTGAPGVYVLPATPDGPVPARVGAGDVPVWRQGYRAGDTDRIALLNACSLPIDICMFR